MKIKPLNWGKKWGSFLFTFNKKMQIDVVWGMNITLRAIPITYTIIHFPKILNHRTRFQRIPNLDVRLKVIENRHNKSTFILAMFTGSRNFAETLERQKRLMTSTRTSKTNQERM